METMKKFTIYLYLWQTRKKNQYYLLIVYIYNACANLLSITVVFFAKSNKKASTDI